MGSPSRTSRSRCRASAPPASAGSFAKAGAKTSLLYICAGLPLFLGGELAAPARTTRRVLIGAYLVTVVIVVLAVAPLAAAPGLARTDVPGVELAAQFSGTAPGTGDRDRGRGQHRRRDPVRVPGADPSGRGGRRLGDAPRLDRRGRDRRRGRSDHADRSRRDLRRARAGVGGGAVDQPADRVRGVPAVRGAARPAPGPGMGADRRRRRAGAVRAVPSVAHPAS